MNGVRAAREMVYHDPSNAITMIDERGWRQRFEYTPLGMITKVYLAERNVPSSADRLAEDYSYDSIERLVQQRSYNGMGTTSAHVRLTTTYLYDSHDRLTSKTIPQISYREDHSYIDVWSDPAEPGKKFVYRGKTIVGDQHAPSIVSCSSFDQNGNVIKEFLDGTRVSTYAYDKMGNRIRQTDGLNRTTLWHYDYAGRRTATVRSVAGQSQTATENYDSLGNLTSSADYMGNTTQYTYDALGRRIKQAAPFDTRVATTKFYYSATGNLLRQSIDQGSYFRETGYAYDARNRQTKIYTYRDTAGQQWDATEFDYDGAGNKVAMRTGYSEISSDYASFTYAYDRFGNVVQTVDALGQQETFTYDAVGRLLSKTDREGNVTSYVHDSAGRLTRSSVTVKTLLGKEIVSELETQYTKTGRKRYETADETENGWVKPELLITYTYDAKGRLVTETNPAGIVQTCTYDIVGNRKSFRLQKDGTTEVDLYYEYDELNRLTHLRRNGSSGELLASYTYDKNGNRLTLTHPANNLTTTYTYNKANLITSLINKKGAAVDSSFSYTYTIDGNQVSKTGQDGKTVSYTYDRMGRLTKETDPIWREIAYSYDPYSNRTKMTIDTVPTAWQKEHSETTYVYDKNNRLLRDTKTHEDGTKEEHRSFYDRNGNQVRRERESRPPSFAASHPLCTLSYRCPIHSRPVALLPS